MDGKWGTGIHALTRRERQVLDLTLRGLRLQDIAERIFLNFKSVATYRKRALDKLGVRSPRELPSWYMASLVERYGILVPPGALQEPGVGYLDERERKAA